MPAPNPFRDYSYDGQMMAEGQKAEGLAYDFLQKTPGVELVHDVRNDPVWQKVDVDFRARRMGGQGWNVEVKSDVHIARTGNVLFELLRVHHTSPEHCAYLGWTVFSKATRLMVWCPPAHTFYWFVMADLRRGMQQYLTSSRDQAQVTIVPTDSRRTTFNLLIPLTFVPHLRYLRTAQGWRKAL